MMFITYNNLYRREMNYLRITYPDLANGNGVRVTLWIPGCTHKCPGCHNSWTADYNQGKFLGKEEFDKLVNILNNEYVDGLTISGGDPLDQSDEVLMDIKDLIVELRNNVKRNFNIWIYSGYYKEDLIRPWQKRVLEVCDVLVDGPYEQKNRNIMLPFRGSSNQHIWDLHTNSIINDKNFMK